jgi:Tol biopolymer transport system component
MKNKSTKTMMGALFMAMVGALVCLAGSARQAQEPGVLLRAAIEKEEVDGDLPGAIELYGQIAAKFGGHRAVAAQALLRMGGCYEKLGAAQAILAQKAFEKLVADYPDQAEAVSAAKKKLSALLTSRAASGTAEFRLRQVWAGPGVDTEGQVSADGRYLTFVDWDTGDLAVRDLTAGTNRRLTNKGTWEQSDEMAGESKWSRDGRRIAYQWYGKDGVMEIRVMDVADSSTRTIRRNKSSGDWLQVFDWSPDGKHVLAFIEEPPALARETQIGLISVEDGAIIRLKGRFEDSINYSSRFLFSPDGRHIAYDTPPAGEETGRHDIFLISLADQTEIPLVEHPEDDAVVAWTPDGKGLLFTSNRTGSQDLWLLPMSEGTAQDPPRLIKSGFGPGGSLGITSHGELYFGSSGSAQDIYVLDVDSEKWKALSTPKKLALPNQGRILGGVYSMDGQRMAISSLRVGGRHQVLSILDEKTGRIRELNVRLPMFAFLAWIPPDGRDFSVGSYDREGRNGLYRVDAQTGEAVPIIRFEPGQGSRACVWSIDGKRLFYAAEDKSKGKSSIYVYDLETKKSEPLVGSPDDARIVAVSPDGRWLAVANGGDGVRTIKVMPSSGGEPRELFRSDFESGTLILPAWSLDGRFVYFPWVRKSNENVADLYRVSRDGGPAERIDLGMRFVRFLSVHPDGKRIAFWSPGEKPGLAQVWVMENFLPKAAEKK